MDRRSSVEVKKRKKRGRLGCESPDRLFLAHFPDSKKEGDMVEYH